MLDLIIKNILIHGLGQDDKSWDKVKEYLREYNQMMIVGLHLARLKQHKREKIWISLGRTRRRSR
ncbi:hypothetical protein HMPREF0077_0782 [Anaerococcus tetradius ATCC 35098]|uniref:Uncharacterized protein n=2 Tax=Anaerococcus tetradius TaxID=33036 RepID=C2CH22_9FIRM|nr:hypothetical protein HMPREF0077_0782 [Anaerococcus tetradius ATCC 35098]